MRMLITGCMVGRPQQQAHLGVLVSAMTAVHPHSVVHRFVPLCLRILLVSPADKQQARTPRTPKRQPGPPPSPSSVLLSPALTHSDSDDMLPRMPSLYSQRGLPDGLPYTLAVLSEKEIVYYFNIMRYIVENAGEAVLPFKEKMMAAVDLALQFEERPGVVSLKVFKTANKLVRSLLHALVTCRPREARSVPPPAWNSPEWQSTHYESWGHVVSMADAKITWRVPSAEGLSWASDLAGRYLKEPMTVLRGYLESFAEQPGTAAVPASSAPLDTAGGERLACSSDGHGRTGALMRGPRFAGAGGAGGSASSTNMDSPRGRIAAAKRIKIAIPQSQSLAGGEEGGAAAVEKNKGHSRVTHVQARNAVLQIRYVLEGVVAAMPDWEEDVGEGSRDDVDMMDEDEDELLSLGKEEYSSGTYELPAVADVFKGEAHSSVLPLARSPPCSASVGAAACMERRSCCGHRALRVGCNAEGVGARTGAFRGGGWRRRCSGR